MAQITYADKSAINTNSGVADINKCNASDMNEIKTVVNTNATTLDTLAFNVTDNGSEVKTGFKYNNKDVYIKRYYWSSPPNNTTSQLSLGFSLSATTIFKIEGFAISNSGNFFPLISGDVNNDTNGTVQVLLINNDTIQLRTYNGNFQTGKAYANVYYIYNS